MDINYNNNFLYDYNIFNNRNIGIGTNNPEDTLSINGNMYINGNINIKENIYVKEKLNKLNIFNYNVNNNEIKAIEIDNEENSIYDWINNESNLDFNYSNNIDNIYHVYISEEYLIINNQINIYNVNKIIIRNLFLYKKENSTDLGILTDMENLNNITINNININKINNYYYELEEEIIINKDTINSLNFINLNGYYVKLIGYYEMDKGNMWDYNIKENNIFVKKNIGILSSNTNNYNLYINGNSIISLNLNVNNNIISNNGNIININNSGKLITKNIENISENLNINLNKKKVSICTLKTNNFCNIGDNNEISLEGNVNCINYNINENIILNNKRNFVNLKNKNIIKFLEENIKISNIEINKRENENSILDDINVIIRNNVNINIKNKEGFYVYGNGKITGNIEIKNNLNIETEYIRNTTQKQNLLIKNLNMHTNINSDLIINNNNIIGNNINSNIIKTNIIKLPTINNNNKIGSIYYDNIEKKFKGFNDTEIITFKNINEISESINDNSSIINVNNMIINNLNIINKISLPKKNEDNIDYKGELYFNLSKLKGEIFNGFKYGTIEYETKIVEIENINLYNSNNINKLKPLFHKRIRDYIYDDNIPNKIYIIINPKSKIKISIGLNETIINEEYGIFRNNLLEHNIVEVDLSNLFNIMYNKIIIKQEHINLNKFLIYKIKSNNIYFNITNFKINIYGSDLRNNNLIIKKENNGFKLIHNEELNINNVNIIINKKNNEIVYKIVE